MTEIQRKHFGTTQSGEAVSCFTLRNTAGMSAEILTYGGILRTLTLPTGGGARDVVLGFDSVSDYERQDKYIGALVGRVANRIGNARFTLRGKAYVLSANAAPSCLHGGAHGFHEKLWAAAVQNGKLHLSYTSPDGEEGFPGTLRVKVVYSLTDSNALVIAYFAESERETIVNLTNHSYFNLNGQGIGTVEDHTVQLFAHCITENDGDAVPTGRLLPVDGTAFDLRKPTRLRPGLESTHAQILSGAGYDHNFVLKTRMDGLLRLAAVVEAGGVRMECLTTQPGIQLYTANFLAGERGKGGACYPRRAALALETQNWPDAIHHPKFPSPVLCPGETYHHETVYRFSL